MSKELKLKIETKRNLVRELFNKLPPQELNEFEKAHRDSMIYGNGYLEMDQGPQWIGEFSMTISLEELQTIKNRLAHNEPIYHVRNDSDGFRADEDMGRLIDEVERLNTLLDKKCVACMEAEIRLGVIHDLP